MYDYVIVGAGPAGCVLANRLSADSSKRILLLEAGPADRHPFIHMPKGFGRVLDDPQLTWHYDVENPSNHNAQPRRWVRGKVLGGSSSVNGLVYVRGQPADFDDLADLTSSDWTWRHIRAAYIAMERHELGAGEARGDAGPFRISLPPRHPLMDALIAAGGQLGLEAQDDINRPDDAEKIGYVPAMIARGRRQSASAAFLRPVRGRANLEVATGVLVDRILFDGRRATGVAVTGGDYAPEVRAHRVILCAGALASPLILQRSGIGPAGLLARHGIDVVVDNPEVGRNLQEHCTVMQQWQLARPLSQNFELRGFGAALSAARYALARGGVLSHSPFSVGAWFRTDPRAGRPDAQLLAGPLSIDFTAKGRQTHAFHGIQAGGWTLRPRSRGFIEITSAAPTAAPRISLDYLADPEDRADMIRVLRRIRELFAQSPIAELIGEELRPGPAVQSDEEILDTYRQTAGPGHHAAGTCRMGQDAGSVVDPSTRVRGVEGLHVMDLSVQPFILSGNTTAPVAAMAWRAADLLAAM